MVEANQVQPQTNNLTSNKMIFSKGGYLDIVYRNDKSLKRNHVGNENFRWGEAMHSV